MVGEFRKLKQVPGLPARVEEAGILKHSAV
jgi:hypothetical protein